MKNLFRFLAAGIALTLILSACGSESTTNTGSELSGSLEPQPLENPVTLKVSIASPNETFNAVRVADFAGELEKENIKIEYVTLPSTESIPALATGTIDVAAVGVTVALFNAVAGGADVRFVMMGGESPTASGVYVHSDLADLGPTALKGKTLGLSLGWGQTSSVLLEDYLQSGGLTIDDIEVATIPLEDLAMSLDTKVIDMTVLSPPSSLLFEKNGNAKVVARFENSERIAGYAFGPRLLKEEPAVGQAFIRALMRTINTYFVGDYKSNPDTLTLISKAMNLDEQDVLLTESISFRVFSQNEVNNGAFDIYARAQDLWKRAGLLTYEELLEPSQYTDWSFVQRILDNQ